MRPRIVAVLAVIAAGLLVVVLLDGDDAARAGDKRLLSGLRTDQVVELTLGGEGRATVRLVRGKGAGSGAQRTGTFELVEGSSRGAADEAAVRKLLSTLEFLEPLRELPKGRGLRQLGLAPPRLKIGLRLRGRDKLLELSLGAGDPSGTGVYARAGAATPVVLAKEVFETFDVGAAQLRDRELVPFAAAQIERLSWRDDDAPGKAGRTGTTVDVARGADGRWWLAGKLLASTRGVERLAGAAAALRATRFIAARGTDKLSRTLRLLAGKKTLTLRIGGACPGRAGERRIEREKTAEVSALRGCVAATALAAFEALKGKAVLRERAPLRLRPADVEWLALRRGGAALKLVRAGAGWKLVSKGGAKKATDGEPDGEKADGEALRRAIAALRQLQGIVEPMAPAALATRFAAANTTVVTVGAGKQRRVLRFGAAVAGRLPLRRDDEAATLWLNAPLPAPAQPLLSASALSWRERTVLRIPDYELAGVTIARRGEPMQRAERKDGAWKSVTPAKGAVDSQQLAKLSERVGSLRVTTYLDTSAAPTTPADAVVTLLRRQRTIAGKTNEQQHRLELWRRAGTTGQGSCVGRLGKTVFRLDWPTCVTLTDPLVASPQRPTKGASPG